MRDLVPRERLISAANLEQVDVEEVALVDFSPAFPAGKIGDGMHGQVSLVELRDWDHIEQLAVKF